MLNIPFPPPLLGKTVLFLFSYVNKRMLGSGAQEGPTGIRVIITGVSIRILSFQNGGEHSCSTFSDVSSNYDNNHKR